MAAVAALVLVTAFADPVAATRYVGAFVGTALIARRQERGGPLRA
ncbi:hypothetical protein BJY17_003388 [Agromyces hippuratus]|uniref:Uncharacterized protein n=1 Tax=Agromyces hippuratus TaxID=286438 RepID=A0A852X9Q3_9MICO|nr:hypothetical protein [Agromyces hippuratus]NYG22641.1 hypothetical protein [Agromyces hippuratus]